VSEPPPTKVSSSLSIVALVAVGIVGAVVLSIARPEKDNLPTIIQIGLLIGLAITYMKAQSTHLLVNSEMTAYKRDLAESSALIAAIARAQGVKAGGEAERDRAEGKAGGR
jgi:hypothetical protein